MTHYTNTKNPIDFPKMKSVHIVSIHPLENGEPNLTKIQKEFKFDDMKNAKEFVEAWNTHGLMTQANYGGLINK